MEIIILSTITKVFGNIFQHADFQQYNFLIESKNLLKIKFRQNTNVIIRNAHNTN